MRRFFLPLFALSLAGCPGVLQGPSLPSEEVAAPTPIKEVLPVRQSSQPPPGPVTDASSFRAWRSPYTAEDGTKRDGFWVTIPAKAPAAETIEPDKVLPRAPHTPPAPKPAPGRPPAGRPAAPPVSSAVPGLPPSTPSSPIPALTPQELQHFFPGMGQSPSLPPSLGAP